MPHTAARQALLDIAGKPMVVHVTERAQASGADEVCIATMTNASAWQPGARLHGGDDLFGTRLRHRPACRGRAAARLARRAHRGERAG